MAAYPVVAAERLVIVYGLVGGTGLALLAAGLAAGWSGPVACSLAVLGAEYALRFALGPATIDAWTPLYAGGFLLAAETAYWSLERRVRAAGEPGMALRRAASVVLTAAAGTFVAALVVIAAGTPLHGGLGLEILGVLAATVALALVAAAARSQART